MEILDEVQMWLRDIDDSGIDSRFASPDVVVQLMVVGELRDIREKLDAIYQEMPD